MSPCSLVDDIVPLAWLKVKIINGLNEIKRKIRLRDFYGAMHPGDFVP